MELPNLNFVFYFSCSARFWGLFILGVFVHVCEKLQVKITVSKSVSKLMELSNGAISLAQKDALKTGNLGGSIKEKEEPLNKKTENNVVSEKKQI